MIRPLKHRDPLHPSGLVTTKRDAARLEGSGTYRLSLLLGRLVCHCPFPRIFFDTGDGLSDEMLTASSSGYGGGQASTPFGHSLLGTPEKYTALSCEWIFT